jgi:hypothetical protein
VFRQDFKTQMSKCSCMPASFSPLPSKGRGRVRIQSSRRELSPFTSMLSPSARGEAH